MAKNKTPVSSATKKPVNKTITKDKAPVFSNGMGLTTDSYTNVLANLGVGSNNLSQLGGYVMTHLTWDYWTLNILYRNNWIVKGIVDKPAEEMLKNGFEIQTQLDPDIVTDIQTTFIKTRTKDKFLDCIKWGRLYGGCIGVPLIEGQEDLSTPLDYDDILPQSFKGLMVVDRWSGISPSLEIVTDISSPEFGLPMFYDVSEEATGQTVRVHHTRCIRFIGRQLPYWEKVSEVYWGASEIEHVYTEVKKRDETSANIAYLIFLANIRVLKSGGLNATVALGDQEAVAEMYKNMQAINQAMANTGLWVIDKDDEFQEHQYTFSGINDIYESFMLDVAGAAEMPVTKLFGRSPSGMNSTGESELQNYYDMIEQKQETDIRYQLEKLLKVITMSVAGIIPDDFQLVFNPIRRPSDIEKANLAQSMSQPVYDGYDRGLFGVGTVLRELKSVSKLTGQFTNITDKMIEEADKEDEEKKKEEKEMQELLLKAEQEPKEDTEAEAGADDEIRGMGQSQ